MIYQTYSVHPDLETFLKCFWTMEDPKNELREKQTIVPDGCVEMIFHYGDPYRQFFPDGRSLIQPKCFVIGQLTRPLEIAPLGKTGIFSARFHPHGFTPFAQLPIKDLENKAVTLDLIFGNFGLNLEDQVLQKSSNTDRIKIVENFLLQQLQQQTTIDRIIQSTLEAILEFNGHEPVDRIAEKINTHRRKLERKFSTGVGLSPKYLSRIVRLQFVLKKLLNENYTSLTDLAYQGGFYDQAHFIKEFKEFTGQTPKAFFKGNLKMSSIFYH